VSLLRGLPALSAYLPEVEDPLGSANALNIPLDSTISVNHKASVDARLIRVLQRRGVKYLSSRSIGLDHIDSDAAKMAGILVESVAYSPESVAEYTIMLMLMALRNAGSILRRAHNCDFRLEVKRASELREMGRRGPNRADRKGGHRTAARLRVQGSGI